MPHVDIRYKEETLSGDLLFETASRVAEIVGQHFNENPDYVSIEVLPQTRWTLNRKGVDLEVSASPDPEGKRVHAAAGLANDLANWLNDHLKEHGVHCEISTWVRIFDAGIYEYRP